MKKLLTFLWSISILCVGFSTLLENKQFFVYSTIMTYIIIAIIFFVVYKNKKLNKV